MTKKIVLFLLLLNAFIFGTVRLYTGKNPLPIILKALPIPSTILGPPKGYVYAKQAHPDGYTPLISAYETEYPAFPLIKPLKSEIRTFPEVFVLELENARIFGSNGVVITAEDKVLADTAIDWIPSIENHKIFRKNRLPRPEYIDETIAVIASKSSNCFFHWMVDILPKLEILKRSQISYDKIYINPLDFPFQKETISHLGLDEKKIIWASPKRHILAKKIVVPSLPGGFSSGLPEWSCHFLKSQFLKVSPPQAEKKIYVSRKKALTRKILNEKELIVILKKMGFIEVVLEDLSIFEQAELFASSKCIVAPHGAGLTNLIYCKEHTKVIEIFSPNYINPCYWNLSHDINLSHTCLLGNQEGLSKEEIQKNDIKVDITEILNQINSLSF